MSLPTGFSPAPAARYGLDGRVALVTGAGHGIGRAIAARLAAEGCAVGLLDIAEEAAEAVAAQAREAGGRAAAAAADIGDAAQAAAAMTRLQDLLGPCDILVNNAGISRMGRVLDLDLADWRESFRVNTDGVLHGCRAVVPGMAARGRGRVINTASWFGKRAQPGYAAYCCSKFAVIGLTQALALEVAGSGVTVNAVCPGTIVETAMREAADAQSRRLGLRTAREREHLIPLGRVGLPEDIARVVAFLASDEAAYMTGQAINVDGGLWLH